MTWLGLIWMIAMGGTAIGTYLTLKKLGTPPPPLYAPFALYPVSILEPVKGVDRDLKNNL